MTLALLLVLLSAATYRAGRFVILDTLWEEWRQRLLDRLTTIEHDDASITIDPKKMPNQWHLVPLWRRKVHDLLVCPYCVTGWTAAGATVIAMAFVDSIPLPVFMWAGAWTGGLVLWAIVDHD